MTERERSATQKRLSALAEKTINLFKSKERSDGTYDLSESDLRLIRKNEARMKRLWDSLRAPVLCSRCQAVILEKAGLGIAKARRAKLAKSAPKAARLMREIRRGGKI